MSYLSPHLHSALFDDLDEDLTDQGRGVVVENVSFILHEKPEDVDDLSLYNYSTAAPSVLGDASTPDRSYTNKTPSPRNLSPADYAQKNISQYFRRRTTDNDKDPSIRRKFPQKDEILGSLPHLIPPPQPHRRNNPATVTPVVGEESRESYTDIVLGLSTKEDDSTSKTMSNSSLASGGPEDAAKTKKEKEVTWFRLLAGCGNKKKRAKKSKKNSSANTQQSSTDASQQQEESRQEIQRCNTEGRLGYF